jgi:hypothetical protein
MKRVVWISLLFVLTVGWTWPSSLGGVWQGPAVSTICGKKSEQPLEVSLKIENVPSVPKENGPSASASLAQLVGTPIGPLSIKLKDTDYKRDDGMFVGSFTNTSTCTVHWS